jgi:hypothetical protein
MYVRVVRFTGVTPERLEGLEQRISSSGGPPEGVVSTGIKFLYDADQQTMVVLQYFDSAEAMETSAKALEAMDPSETPGTRASVDTTEVKFELDA